MVGAEKHAFLVNRFLKRNGQFLHALELNGLRHWDENRAVRQLAAQWNMLLISGGDRHGVEPNANINLTNATSFTEFVHEIRNEKRSKILFMPQYAEPWKHRILRSAIDAIRDYPEFPQGSQKWDERVYHPNAKGVDTPVSRTVAERIGALADAVVAIGSAAAGPAARFERPAHGLERIARAAPGAGRSRGIASLTPIEFNDRSAARRLLPGLLPRSKRRGAHQPAF